MSKSDDPKDQKGSAKALREAELAAALRANLRRRKAPAARPAKPAAPQE